MAQNASQSSQGLRNNYQKNVQDPFFKKSTLKELSGYNACVFMFDLKH